MPRVRKSPPPPRTHRWFLAEWAEHHGKRQADAIRDLGWSRSSASDLWTNKQRYTQDHVEEVAGWLNTQPYELLLPPKEALALRGMREMAIAIAAENGGPGAVAGAADIHELPPGRRTGTDR